MVLYITIDEKNAETTITNQDSGFTLRKTEISPEHVGNFVAEFIKCEQENVLWACRMLEGVYKSGHFWKISVTL